MERHRHCDELVYRCLPLLPVGLFSHQHSSDLRYDCFVSVETVNWMEEAVWQWLLVAPSPSSSGASSPSMRHCWHLGLADLSAGKHPSAPWLLDRNGAEDDELLPACLALAD